MNSTFDRIRAQKPFQPPPNWHQFTTVDMHTGGEPLRVIVDGFPELNGESVLERRRYCKDNFDHFRTTLMHEPRGHADMYGCLLVPPNDDEADFGILFLHNEGYSTMCGHAIIAISTLAAQMGWVDIQDGQNKLCIDAPCGRIESFVNVADGKVENVSFHCVPSFVVGLDRTIDVPGLGTITYDLAYGGAFYSYVDLRNHNLGLRISQGNYQDLISCGMNIKRAVIEADTDVQHPFEEDLSFLYGTIFIDESANLECHSRNVCVFADGEVDRCPTGSGVSGRMAIHFERKEIEMGKSISIESISGSVFDGSVVSSTQFGPFDAVIPKVTGTAHVTGVHNFCIDPMDPMRHGFLLR